MRQELIRIGLWVSIALLLSCANSPQHLNVLLIGIDTLRPDHLGCYGYNQSTSPNIDKLAGEGVLFENVLSSSPWTLPSFATVLTSLQPIQHGANAAGARINTTFPPLPMMLLKHGYSTAAVINAPYLTPGCGMSRGFESYDAALGGVMRPASRTTEEALAQIDSKFGRPFFMFVHYFDPHYPYAPPEEYRGVFGPAEPGPGGAVPGKRFEQELLMDSRMNPAIDLAKVTDQQWAYIKGLYDGEIAYVDKAVGDLLSGLEQRGLRENTVIVLLSDHGEEFNEHGGFEHGHTLYNELLRVPLVVSLPGVIPEGVRIERQVRLVDVMPTILDILGLAPTTHVEGVSLKPLMEGDEAPKFFNATLLPAEVAYSGAVLYGPDEKCVTAYPWKLIRDVRSGCEVLFNLGEDPGEVVGLTAVPGAEVALAASEAELALAAMHEVMVKTLIGISDTWYVRILADGEGGGGEGEDETFDVTISLDKNVGNNSIFLCEFLDEKGEIVEEASAEDIEVSKHSIEIEGLEVEDSITLAFKVGPGQSPLKFDLEIDGMDATDCTFIGETLAAPARMPFVERNERARARSLGEPTDEPDGPCYLVWHSGTGADDTSRIEFDEATRKALKAVGYLQ